MTTEKLFNVHDTAARELSHYLSRWYVGAFTVQSTGTSAGAEYFFDLQVDASVPKAVQIDADLRHCRIVGRTDTDLLHGVYLYLERCGAIFGPLGVREPIHVLRELPRFELSHTPYLERRGIRQHINFPMDISSYPLWEALEYIRNMARMKFNTLTFHLYEACGWYTLDTPQYKAKTRWQGSHTTFFYSEPHLVPREPEVARHIRNEQHFCPPEVESIYGKEASQVFAVRFLKSLIQEARRFGMEVTLSIESFTPKVYPRFHPDYDVNRELLAETGKALVRQVLECYPEITRLEIISREWTQVETTNVRHEIKQKLAELVDEVTARDILVLLEDGLRDYPEFLYLDPAGQLKMFLDALYAIQSALDTFDAVGRDPHVSSLLNGKDRAIGLYHGTPGIVAALTRTLEEAVSPDFTLTWIAAHGARRTQENLERASFCNGGKRLQLYSWVEIDGMMYSMQYAGEAMRENLKWIKQQQGSLLFHHWRTAENELGLLAAADAAFYGPNAEAQSRRSVAPFLGLSSEETVPLLEELEGITMDTVSKSVCGGFCFFPVWWNGAQMQSLVWVKNPEFFQPFWDRIDAMLVRLDALIQRVDTLPAREALTGLRGLVESTGVHSRCYFKMYEMRQSLLERQDIENPAPEEAQRFLKLGEEAMDFARHWVRISSGNIRDRGGEGNVVSYAHVIIRYIQGNMRKYGHIADHEEEIVLDPLLAAPHPMVT